MRKIRGSGSISTFTNTCRVLLIKILEIRTASFAIGIKKWSWLTQLKCKSSIAEFCIHDGEHLSWESFRYKSSVCLPFTVECRNPSFLAHLQTSPPRSAGSIDAYHTSHHPNNTIRMMWHPEGNVSEWVSQWECHLVEAGGWLTLDNLRFCYGTILPVQKYARN